MVENFKVALWTRSNRLQLNAAKTECYLVYQESETTSHSPDTNWDWRHFRLLCT